MQTITLASDLFFTVTCVLCQAERVEPRWQLHDE
jgi:hypothetical protein